MSIVVESVSTAAMADSTTISINKPTGLAEGDLMVAVVAGNDGGNAITIPSGWTSILNNSTTPSAFGWYRAAYKVAEASDVAASNFTFTNGDGGVIYRMTGYATPSLIKTGTGAVNSTDNHVILFNITADNGGRTTTFSGYSVTGGTSVSFTERYDDSNSVGIRVSLGVADGQYASGSNITAFSVTVTGAVDDDNEFMIVVPASVNVNPSVTSLIINSEMPAPATTGGATANVDAIAITSEMPNPTIDTTGGKNWTGRSKGSGSWTPRNK